MTARAGSTGRCRRREAESPVRRSRLWSLRHDHGALGLKLGQPRSLAASALVLVLTAATGILGLAQLRSTANAYEALVDRDAGLTKDLLEMQVAVHDEAVGVRGFLLSQGEEDFLTPYHRGTAAFARELAQAQTKLDDAEDFSRLEDIRRRHEALIPVYERAIALTRRGRPRVAADLGRTAGQREREGLIRSLNALVSSEADELYSGRVRVSGLQRTSEIAILAVLGLALLAAAVVARMAVRATRRGAGAEADARRAREAAAEEAAVARIATAIVREAEPRAVLEAAAREAATLLGAAAAAIMRFEAGARAATVAGTAGGAADAGRRVQVAPDDVLGACAVDREARDTDDGGSPVKASALKSPEVGSELAVAIRVGGDPWGAIWVATAPGVELGAEAADRLERFAELASASISGADARAHLAQLALEDSLTGLANHRHFHERLRAEVARAQRHERPLSVVLFDIDHFADVNDLYGHQVGDVVLRETAERIAACARSGELIARIGGEQFGWILPEAAALDAYQAAERARRLLQVNPMTGGIRLTASAGVCDLEQAASAGELMRFADGALFWAKAHGRDMTFRYSPDVVTELSAAEQLEHLRRTRTIVGIRALARAVDVKDHSTARHSERVADMAVAIARVLGCGDRFLDDLHEAALVHDVGKIGVPDAILLKPSRLDPQEYREIKRHPCLSAEIVDDVLTEEQVAWVRGHHERFDGRGYPDGLADRSIALGARILAVADAWDVMTSERPYSAARTLEEALGEMRAQSGRQFCPSVVGALEVVIAERRAARLAGDSEA